MQFRYRKVSIEENIWVPASIETNLAESAIVTRFLHESLQNWRKRAKIQQNFSFSRFSAKLANGDRTTHSANSDYGIDPNIKPNRSAQSAGLLQISTHLFENHLLGVGAQHGRLRVVQAHREGQLLEVAGQLGPPRALPAVTTHTHVTTVATTTRLLILLAWHHVYEQLNFFFLNFVFLILKMPSKLIRFLRITFCYKQLCGRCLVHMTPVVKVVIHCVFALL